MSFRRVIFLSLITMFLCASVFAQSDDEMTIFNLVNNERIKARLRPLVWDDHVAKVARSYSRKMAKEGFFEHSDRDGKTVIDRAEEADLRGWSKIGENLFLCDEDPMFTRLSVRGWMSSTSHRRNILSRDWTATGIGIARSRDDRIYITQVFIR